MDIKTLESFKLSDAVKFHDTLNPRIWSNEKLRPEVKDQLLLIANDFVTELGIKDLDVADITISGSNAAYTYTKHSDLDLHILVDFSKLPDDEIYSELFNAKKNQYNDSHDITIHGVPIELYVQDTNEPVISLGEYSLLKNEWIKFPKKRRANLDQAATRKKYEKLLDVVKTALKYKDEEKVDNIIQTIRRYRQAGLDKGGEFSPENLAFKMLRSQGYIDKLYKIRGDLHSKGLSIESQHEETLAEKYKREFIMTDEDYDPNGPPPGPEFKPTMPAGTVRVDVSDVYDWYKLGQHISNMKGLGNHDFGKGPPSTIMSFGDEDTEHKYIKDLEKTGLKTTDIDPVDPKQPKGMKRQKVDPTYNVNEAFDNPYPLKWEKGEFGSYDAYTKLPDGTDLEILFSNDNPWHAEFYRNSGQEVSGEGDSQRIFATVLYAIGHFIKKKKPEVIVFSSESSGDPAGTRTSLYNRMVDRYASKLGYTAERYFDSTRDSMKYKLTRINLKESASGYIPSDAEKDDPRFKTALTVDIKPDTLMKNAKKLGSKISRAGIPPIARPDGKF